MLRSRRIGATRDIELYRALLGVSAPWTVAEVNVDLPGQQVVVRVDAGPGPFACPACGRSTERYDSKPRRWRHLNTMQFTTWLEADVPRVQCPTHGVKQIRVPWAEPGSQFTALFERLAIDLLRECSVAGAGRLLRISWDEAWGIKGRAVQRGLAQRGGLTAVAMDMWEPYVQSTRTALPQAATAIVFDKFHIVKHLHDAVDRVRRGEHRVLRRAGDERLTSATV